MNRDSKLLRGLLTIAVLLLTPTLLRMCSPTILHAQSNGPSNEIDDYMPYDVPAGTPGIQLSLSGSFATAPTYVCVYTGYGSVAPIAVNAGADTGQAVVNVPASTIQNIPLSEFDTYGTFYAVAYIAPDGTTPCTGGFDDTFTNEAVIYIELPDLYGIDLAAVQQANPALSGVAAPRQFVLEGYDFSSTSTVSVSDGTSTFTPAYTLLTPNSVRVDVPAGFSANATSLTATVCTTTGGDPYCLGTPVAVQALGTNPGTLTTTPAGSATPTMPVSLLATFGSTSSTLGVPSGAVTFTDTTTGGTTTLGTAPLSLVTGYFAPATPAPMGDGFYADGVKSILADLNRNGLQDVLLVTNTYVNVVLASSATGNLARIGSIARDSDYCESIRSVAVADFNGDGYPDVAMLCSSPSSSNEGNVIINFNQGDGSFVESTITPLTVGPASLITAADFNKDGKIDLAVTGPDGNTDPSGNAENGITVYFGDGNGNFTATSPTVPAPNADGSQIVAADFNNDGYPDLAILSNTGGTTPVVIFQNDGTGSFGSAPTATLLFSDGNSATQFFLRTLPGSSYPDIVAIDAGGDTAFYVATNNKTSTISFNSTYASVSVPGLLSATLGDFNADGYPDVAVFDGSNVSIYPGAIDGTYSTPIPSFTMASAAYSLIGASDPNADGYADLIALEPSSDSGSVAEVHQYITSGTASATLPNLRFASGTHNLTATTPGTASLAAGTASTSLTSSTASATLLLNVAPAGGTSYDSFPPITLQASINTTSTPAPTGSVTFYDGATLLTTVAVGPLSANGSFASVNVQLNAGSHQLSFTYSGDGNYSPGSSPTQSYTVTQAAPTITFVPNPASNVYGTAVTAGQLDATSSIAGNIVYTDVNGKPVTTSTVLPAGMNVITATFTPTDTTNYSDGSKSATIIVTQATPSITFLPNPASNVYGTAVSAGQLDATSTVAGTFAYTDSGRNPVTMSTVLPVGMNIITATFTPTDTTNYSSGSKTAAITVTQATPTLTFVPSPSSNVYGATVNAGQLDATSTVAGTFAYTDVNGKPVNTSTVLPAGMNIITATFTPDDNTDYSGGSKTATITVTQAAPTLTFTPSPASNVYGTPVAAGQFDATSTISGTFGYTDVNGKPVTTSTVLPAGMNVITATFTPTDTTDYSGGSKNATITVTQATATITFAPSPSSNVYGATVTPGQLDATSTVAGTFAYTDVNGKPVTASTVLPVGMNLITASFTPTDTADYSSGSKNATITVTQATPTVTFVPNPASNVYGNAVTAGQLDATSTVAGTFAYTDMNGKPVTTSTVLPAGVNVITATLTPTDTTDFSGGSKSATVTVAQAAATITFLPNPASNVYGTAVTAGQLDATSTVAGTFAYTDANGKPVTTSTVLPVGTNVITATFTPTDANDYSSGSKLATITVTQATPTVTFAPSPSSNVYGANVSAGQFDATSTVPGTFAYNDASGKVVTTSTVLPVGMNVIAANFTPTDTTSYSSSSKTATITVTQATPTIAWTPPAAITAGTPLSGTQLDALATGVGGASLPGALTYVPAAGAILPVGTTTLGVTFTPTDTATYKTVTASVPLTVNPAITTTTVSSTVNPSQFGQSITFTVGVTSAYTTVAMSGSLNIYDGRSLLGTASLANPTVSTSTLAAGPHTITAVYAGDSNFSTSTSSALTQTVSASTTTLTWPQPSSIVYGTKLSSTQLNATVATAYASTVPGTFTYTPAVGTLLAAGTQTLSVVFTPTDTVNYKTATGSVSLLVKQATPALSWVAPAAFTAGTPLGSAQLNATVADVNGATLPGTFVYTPATGTALAPGATTLSVTFTPTDAVDYTTVSTSVPLTVNLATPAIAVSSAINPSQYGQSVVFNIAITSAYTGSPITGTVTLYDGKTVLGTPPLSNGAASFSTSTLTAGTHSITAAYAGNSSFASGVSEAITQTVSAAMTKIAWPQPAGVSYGTALSSTQLDATVFTLYATTVPGTFTYTPAAGTVLSAGTQTLSVHFTPTDTVNFAPADGTVTLAVAQVAPVLTWSTPADVVAGTTLSAVQLNATAAGVAGKLDGVFTYTPPAGTVLTAGQKTLSVLFTPTDLTDYSTASTSAPLNVIGVTLTSLSTSTASLGDPAKTITLTGTGFVSDSVVTVNGSNVATTFVNGTTVTAVIPASNFTTAQVLQIALNDPTQAQTTSSLGIAVGAPAVNATLQAPTTIATGDQPNVTLNLINAYPVPITATYTLTFAPAGTNGDDPTVVFSNGLRVVTVTIPANSTTVPPAPLQSGSVAGTITVTLTLTAGGVSVTPANLQPVVIAVPTAPPGITQVTLVRSGNTLTVTIQGYSNTRDIDHVDFHFFPASGAKLSTTDITIQGGTLFGDYYSSSTSLPYGSTFTYTQVFNLDQDATVVGHVDVDLYNALGTSITGTAQ